MLGSEALYINGRGHRNLTVATGQFKLSKFAGREGGLAL